MEPCVLTRPGSDVPWGFRLNGGVDQGKPLAVQRVTPGSVAALSLVVVGEEILRIGNTDASQLTYAAAMETIKGCGDRLELYTSRTGLPRTNEPFSNYNAQPTQLPSTDDHGIDVQEVNGLPADHQKTTPAVARIHDDEDSHARLRHSPAAVADSPGQRRREVEAGAQQVPVQQVPLQQVPVQQQVPDAVLNMASRTAQDKRPWSYAPDMQSLQQQRDRIQRRNYIPPREGPSPRPVGHAGAPASTQPPPEPDPRYQSSPQTQDAVAERNGYSNIYGGPEIPSKTFQRLRSYTPSSESGQTNISGGLARAAQRRQKRRQELHHDGSGHHPIPSARSIRAQEGAEPEKADEKPFDERAYLAGRIPLVRGGPVDPNLFDTQPQSVYNGQPSGTEEEEREDENKKPFDERAYLAGRIPLVRGGEIDPTQFTVPERRVVKKYKEPSRPRLKEPFDERAYLAGKVNIFGDGTEKPRKGQLAEGRERFDVKPSWFKSDDEMVSEDEYDEEAFLRGRIPIVRRSVDRELPPRKAFPNYERATYGHERASWEKEDSDLDSGRGGTCSEPEFDERAFLGGRWKRNQTTNKEYSTDTEADIPSRTIRYLRRSVSSERSTDEKGSGLSGDEVGSDQEKPYDFLMYRGRSNPSKIFSRLKKTMDRKAAAELKAVPADPIERLKEKSMTSCVGIDVDTAIERLEIGKHDPDTYMELLKKSVEQTAEAAVRVEADDEVTDF